MACLALGTAAAACGRDEGTDQPGSAGSETTPDAGAAGRASEIGAGGQDASAAAGAPAVLAGAGGVTLGGGAGTAGTGGGSAGLASTGGVPPLLPGTGVGTIGRTCSRPSECAVGLTCVTEGHLVLGGSAPPHGFCSAPCTSDDQCTDHSPDALCVPFGPGTTASFCVEGCSFGATALGDAKCHGRSDFACAPALLGPTNDTCNTAEDCFAGDLCIAGQCNIVLPACLPSCRGDLDCAPGLFCDQAFLAGTCRLQKPTGKRLGDPCTVPSALEPDEPDGCIGFCQADSSVGSQGHCAATCGLARECAWDPASGKFDGGCFYASILTQDSGDTGDFGFCTPTCNCTDAGCGDPALTCMLLDQGPLSTDFRGPGLCFSDDGSTSPLCGAGGAP